MHCPFCRHADSRVIDSRTSDDGLSIRRRRQCPQCGGRFTTIETASLNVIKRSGVIEPFSREKVMSGVRKACQGRPVTDADLARARSDGGGEHPPDRRLTARRQRDRARDPRTASRSGRGRVPAIRERVPGASTRSRTSRRRSSSCGSIMAAPAPTSDAAAAAGE